jgi:hypothetical protein
MDDRGTPFSVSRDHRRGAASRPRGVRSSYDAGAARGAVINGIPPYGLQGQPPVVGKIPSHGIDAGSYLVGEVFDT